MMAWHATLSIEGAPAVAFLGDYVGLAATAGEVELSWYQSSKPPVTGWFHQITWAATVTR